MLAYKCLKNEKKVSSVDLGMLPSIVVNAKEIE